MLIFSAIALGENPIGLRVGIVNDEFKGSISSCDQRRNVVNGSCDMSFISCRLLTEFNDIDIEQIYYENFNDARQDVKSGKLLTVLHFNSNYSKAYEKVFFTEVDEYDDKLIEQSQVDVHMDQTNHLLSLTLRRHIFDAYQVSTQKLMKSCKLSEKLGSSPLNFLKPIYGDLKSDFKASIEPSVIVITMFYITACLGGFQFLDDRLSGSWNRVLLTGIGVFEVILSHVVLQFVLLMIQLGEVLVVVKLTFPGINTEGMFLLAAVSISIQFSGLFVGMCLACLMKSVPEVTLALTGMAQTLLIISGMINFTSCSEKFHCNNIVLF